MGTAISVNGKLSSVYDQHSTSENRTDGYSQIQVGKPLLVRYLNFYLKHDTAEKDNELMISTFVKTKEKKESAAEAVNYFNPKAKFENNELSISTFGGEHYGHPLIYYTKSYLGESICLTSKIMELDNINDKTVKAIKSGLTAISSLPAFAEFLPYLAGANVGVSLFANIINFFNNDDQIIEGADIDLIFGLNNVSRLQSGRFVCVPSLENDQLATGDAYYLSNDNKLIRKDTGNEYNDGSYFVFQVDSKTNKKYENFDYFLGAADLLKQTNRGGNSIDKVNSVVNLLKNYNDIEAIKEIENLSVDSGDAETNKLIKAYYNSMSNDIKPLYKDKVKDLTSNS